MATKTGRKSRAPKHLSTHSKDCVDLTLIRWMLSLTPAERLQVLQCNVQSIYEVACRADQSLIFRRSSEP